MGGKYQVRTNEVSDFGDTMDYYVNNLLQLIKLLFTKRGKIIFVTKRYY